MGTHPKKLELSWHKPTKQWRKRHRGKEYYLGTGRGKTDLESYERALTKWRARWANLERAAEMERRSDEQEPYRAWGEQLASRSGINVSQYLAPEPSVGGSGKEHELEISEIGRWIQAMRAKPVVARTNGNGQPHTIGTLVSTQLSREVRALRRDVDLGPLRVPVTGELKTFPAPLYALSPGQGFW